MADDLDEFLKQAAQRRQQRQKQRSDRPPVVQSNESSRPNQSQRPTPTPRLEQQDPIPTAKVVEYNQPYTPTVGNLSASLPSSSTSGVSDSVDQADERMQSHLKEVFQHEIGNLRQSDPKRSSKKKQKKEPQLQETPATPAEIQPTAKVSSASLIAQLRDPQSLRMAIIAHEIMKRPWQ